MNCRVNTSFSSKGFCLPVSLYGVRLSHSTNGRRDLADRQSVFIVVFSRSGVDKGQ